MEPLVRILLFIVIIAFSQPVLSTISVLDDKAPENVQKEIKRYKENIVDLLEKKDYSQLDKIHDDLIKSETKFSDGRWQLQRYYVGLHSYKPESVSTPEEIKQHKDNLISIAEEWLSANTDSVAARIFKAQILRNKAWEVRGNKYVKDTPEEVWPKFYEALSNLTEYLIEIKPKAKHDPNWYILLLSAAQGLNLDDEKYMALVNEGLSHHRYYPYIYHVIAKSLLPKWGGSYEAIEAFAQAAVEVTQDKYGAMLYRDIYMIVKRHGKNVFAGYRETNIDRELHRKAMDDAYRLYPTEFNIQKNAALACFSLDMEYAKKYYEMMNKDIVFKSIWTKHYYHCVVRMMELEFTKPTYFGQK